MSFQGSDADLEKECLLLIYFSSLSLVWTTVRVGQHCVCVHVSCHPTSYFYAPMYVCVYVFVCVDGLCMWCMCVCEKKIVDGSSPFLCCP